MSDLASGFASASICQHPIFGAGYTLGRPAPCGTACPEVVRVFKIVTVYNSSFDLITSTFSKGLTTLNTIVCFFLLCGIMLSTLMFTVEAKTVDPVTHERAFSLRMHTLHV
jgi:hypothetical protein